VEHVLDYKSVGDVTQALRDLAPDGIDAYFDNVEAIIWTRLLPVHATSHVLPCAA